MSTIPDALIEQARQALYTAASSPNSLVKALRAIVAAADSVAPVERQTQSGDRCKLIGGGMVEHQHCDDYPDGTVTGSRGLIVRPAKPGARQGFKR